MLAAAVVACAASSCHDEIHFLSSSWALQLEQLSSFPAVNVCVSTSSHDESHFLSSSWVLQLEQLSCLLLQ